MPVFVVFVFVFGWAVFFDEGFEYVLVKEGEGFRSGEVGSVVDGCPVVSVAEELAAESATGFDGGVDLLPEGLEVGWGTEGEGEAGVDEGGFGDLKIFEVCLVDLDAARFEGCFDFWSCFGSCQAVAAAVLGPDIPACVEHGDGVASGSAAEVDGQGWV